MVKRAGPGRRRHGRPTIGVRQSASSTGGAGGRGAVGLRAAAIGALSTGAGAIFALAIRNLAIRHGVIRDLDVRTLRVGRLEIDELVVRQPSGLTRSGRELAQGASVSHESPQKTAERGR